MNSKRDVKIRSTTPTSTKAGKDDNRHAPSNPGPERPKPKKAPKIQALPVSRTAVTGSREELEAFDAIELATLKAYAKLAEACSEEALVERSRAAAKAPRRPTRTAAMLSGFADQCVAEAPDLPKWKHIRMLSNKIKEYNAAHPKERPLANSPRTIQRKIAAARKKVGHVAS